MCLLLRFPRLLLQGTHVLLVCKTAAPTPATAPAMLPLPCACHALRADALVLTAQLGRLDAAAPADLVDL